MSTLEIVNGVILGLILLVSCQIIVWAVRKMNRDLKAMQLREAILETQIFTLVIPAQEIDKNPGLLNVSGYLDEIIDSELEMYISRHPNLVRRFKHRGFRNDQLIGILVPPINSDYVNAQFVKGVVRVYGTPTFLYNGDINISVAINVIK